MTAPEIVGALGNARAEARIAAATGRYAIPTEQAIRAEIDFDAWERCKITEQAENQSLIEVMENWGRSIASAAHLEDLADAGAP